MLFKYSELLRLCLMPSKVFTLIRKIVGRSFFKFKRRSYVSEKLYANIATKSQFKKKIRRTIVLNGIKTNVSENEWKNHYEPEKFKQVVDLFKEELSGSNNEQKVYRVLEIGIGEGRTAGMINDGLMKYYNISIEWFGCDLTFERINNFKSNVVCNLSMASGDLLPFSDSFFDIVYTHHVLEQIPRKFGDVIKEAVRVGKIYFAMEPTVEVADLEGKVSMLIKDHIVGLPRYLMNNYPSYRTITPVAALKSINPTMIYIVNNDEDSRAVENVKYICPLSRKTLVQEKCMLKTEDELYAYPIVNSIPLLHKRYRINISKNNRADAV